MFLKIGDRVVEATMNKKTGLPVIPQVFAEYKKNKHGGTDCTVHVPPIALHAKPVKIGGI